MKRYEALFVLKTAGTEDSIQEMVDRIKAELQKAGAKVSTVQKLDKRTFAYPSEGLTSGFYVNYVFEAEPATAEKLKNHFKHDEEVHRVILVNAPLVIKSQAA